MNANTSCKFIFKAVAKPDLDPGRPINTDPLPLGKTLPFVSQHSEGAPQRKHVDPFRLQKRSHYCIVWLVLL